MTKHQSPEYRYIIRVQRYPLRVPVNGRHTTAHISEESVITHCTLHSIANNKNDHECHERFRVRNTQPSTKRLHYEMEHPHQNNTIVSIYLNIGIIVIFRNLHRVLYWMCRFRLLAGIASSARRFVMWIIYYAWVEDSRKFRVT